MRIFVTLGQQPLGSRVRVSVQQRPLAPLLLQGIDEQRAGEGNICHKMLVLAIRSVRRAAGGHAEVPPNQLEVRSVKNRPVVEDPVSRQPQTVSRKFSPFPCQIARSFHPQLVQMGRQCREELVHDKVVDAIEFAKVGAEVHAEDKGIEQAARSGDNCRSAAAAAKDWDAILLAALERHFLSEPRTAADDHHGRLKFPDPRDFPTLPCLGTFQQGFVNRQFLVPLLAGEGEHGELR